MCLLSCQWSIYLYSKSHKSTDKWTALSDLICQYILIIVFFSHETSNIFRIVHPLREGSDMEKVDFHPQANFPKGGRTHNVTQRTDTQIFSDKTARTCVNPDTLSPDKWGCTHFSTLKNGLRMKINFFHVWAQFLSDFYSVFCVHQILCFWPLSL